MQTTFLKPLIFENSLREALNCTFNIDSSIRKLRGILANANRPSIHMRHDRGRVNFYKYENHRCFYLKKTSDEIYLLARQKYCQLLLDVLTSKSIKNKTYVSDLNKLFAFTTSIYEGNLDLARVVLTPKQYKWFTGRHKTKPFSDQNKAHKTNSGTLMRSKSESLIGNALEAYGIPYIYEQLQRINVFPLVQSLEQKLNATGELKDVLFTLRGNTPLWNVPHRLSWMNNPGSIWRSYFYRDGFIGIYPDFAIMLNDGSLFLWEHEGLSTDFDYRSNAAERVFIMRLTQFLPRENLLATFEHEVVDSNRLNSIIRDCLLPRIWF